MSEEMNRRSRTRANGTGSVYRRGKSWTARAVVGWKVSADGSHKTPVWRTKSGFATKKDAINFLPSLFAAGKLPGRYILRDAHAGKCPSRYTLQDVYSAWEETYASRVGKSTMAGYKSAYAYFKPLHDVYIGLITAADLQQCMDDCPRGKRTHQMMKVTSGLIWAYAVDAQIVDKDITDNLYIGKHTSKQRDPLTEQEVEIIRQAIGKERYAEYIYALCYLGFRPGEFLSLRKDHYRVVDGIEVLVNGSKTDAGRDRVVVIPPQILDIIRDRLWVPGTDLLFPQYVFNRKKTALSGFRQMTDAYFREDVFKPLCARLGIAEGKVPYSARHTYSDKLKRAEGTAKAKAGLMGHTDYAFTASHYQSTDMDDLLEIAATIE